MQPSDFLAPFGRSFGSPRQRPTSMRKLLLRRPRVLPRTRGASETGHRLSARPDLFEEKQGPPGLLGRPLRARHGQNTPPVRHLLAPTPHFEEINGDGVVAFTENRTLGIRNVIVFEAVPPWLTRSRAYASPTPLPTPSQGSLPAWTGSPLAGRDLHPLDDESKFHGVIASPPIPIDQQGLVALNALSASCGGRTRRDLRAV